MNPSDLESLEDEVLINNVDCDCAGSPNGNGWVKVDRGEQNDFFMADDLALNDSVQCQEFQDKLLIRTSQTLCKEASPQQSPYSSDSCFEYDSQDENSLGLYYINEDERWFQSRIFQLESVLRTSVLVIGTISLLALVVTRSHKK